MDTRAAYRYCEEITWSQARNFAYGIRLLPPAKRQALAAVYAFARRIDDIGDGDLPPPAKLAALADARASVTALSAGHHPPGGNGSLPRQNGGPPGDGAADDLVLVALADAANRFDIPLAAFGELIDGCEADVRGTTYRTFDDLLHYCRCVAGSIGRLSLGVFGTADVATAAPLADALGVALQLTNILRDLSEDLRNGRRYLPSEDLYRFGCSVTDGRIDGPAELLVAFEAQRALNRLALGLTLVPLLDRRSAACVLAMAGAYRRLLERIALHPELVLQEGRPRLRRWEKGIVLAQSLARSAA